MNINRLAMRINVIKPIVIGVRPILGGLVQHLIRCKSVAWVGWASMFDTVLCSVADDG